MQLALLIVAAILFLLAALPLPPANTYHATLIAAGLFFLTASFIAPMI